MRPATSCASLRRFQVAGLQFGPLLLEALQVGFGGAQRLVLGQQEITRETVLHPDDIAHLAQLLDALQQHNLHRHNCSPTPVAQPCTNGRSARLRARLMARASSRCFFAETAVMRLGTILPRSDT